MMRVLTTRRSFFPRARDQSARLHAVQQARDVRVARNEPAADFAAGQAVLSRAAQDAQDVVLRSGKAGGLSSASAPRVKASAVRSRLTKTWASRSLSGLAPSVRFRGVSLS